MGLVSRMTTSRLMGSMAETAAIDDEDDVDVDGPALETVPVGL